MKTAQEIRDEWLKCSDDPIYFIKKYILISHPIRGIIPFNLYRFQERIVSEITSHRFSIVRKFRQAGITTLTAAYALWQIIFNEEKVVMVVSIGDRESRMFLERLVNMFDDLPPWLKPQEVERNKHTLKLSTGSRVKAQPAGAGRGEAVSLLIVDEAAFVDKMREFWMAVYPTISTGGSAVLISTVNGMANLYYEIYRDADKGKNNFHVVDIKWQEHPEYTEKWASEIKPNIGRRAWLQEYECEFLGTGDTFIDGETLKRVYDNVSSEYTVKNNNMMRVWKEPQPYHTYMLAADASFGRERDYSAFHIINLYNGEQVAEFYSNKISLRNFAKVISDEGRRYNLAHVIVERNGLGIALIEELFEVQEYDNIWTDEKNEFGFLLTPKVREATLSSLEESIRSSRIKINSQRTADELGVFIFTDTGKVEAEEGYHDDLVMSLAVGCDVMKDISAKSPIAITTKESDKSTPPPTLSTSKYSEHTDIKDYSKWLLK